MPGVRLVAVHRGFGMLELVLELVHNIAIAAAAGTVVHHHTWSYC